MAYVFIECGKCDKCSRQTCSDSDTCHLCAIHKCSTIGCNNECIVDSDTARAIGIQLRPLCFVCENVANHSRNGVIVQNGYNHISGRDFIRGITTPTVNLPIPPQSSIQGIIIRRQIMILPTTQFNFQQFHF